MGPHRGWLRRILDGASGLAFLGSRFSRSESSTRDSTLGHSGPQRSQRISIFAPNQRKSRYSPRSLSLVFARSFSVFFSHAGVGPFTLSA